MHQAAAVAARMAIAAVLLALASSATAQNAPDIAITARVHIDEMIFHEVPNASVTFYLPDRNSTVWETKRENLPDKVQPGVLYRDAGLTLTITSTLPNIEEILNEVLGPNAKENIDANPRPATSNPDDHDDAARPDAVNDNNNDDRRP